MTLVSFREYRFTVGRILHAFGVPATMVNPIRDCVVEACAQGQDLLPELVESGSSVQRVFADGQCFAMQVDRTDSGYTVSVLGPDSASPVPAFLVAPYVLQLARAFASTEKVSRVQLSLVGVDAVSLLSEIAPGL